MNTAQQLIRVIKKHYLLIIAMALLIFFVGGVYLKPDFFSHVYNPTQTPVPTYTGTVIYPLLIYTHTTILLDRTLVIAIALIWIWAWQYTTEQRLGCAILATAGSGLFLCCTMLGSDADFGPFDYINAAIVMTQFGNSDTLQSEGNIYRLILVDGTPAYRGGLSPDYGMILFQCNSVEIICHAALAKAWGTEDPIVGYAKNLRLRAVPGEVDVVIGDTVKFRYSIVQ